MKKILAAIDASPRANGVLSTATELSLSFGASLYVLRVVTVPPEFPAAAAGSGRDALPAHMAAIAMQDLLQHIARLPQGLLATKPLVRVGEPWRVVLATARELDVDIIVMGSHGYGGWDRLLGTTAATVANRADRNVLIVHDRTDSLPGHGDVKDREW